MIPGSSPAASYVQFRSSVSAIGPASSIGRLALNSVGSVVLLVHSFCWFASSVGSLVLLVH